jgi:Zn-dependent protease
MLTRWQVGTLRGIPLYLEPSWFLIFGVVIVGYGLEWQQHYPEWSSVQVWSSSILISLLLFSSVLLHELGHSWVALSQGLPVSSISLSLFGGLATLEDEAKTANHTLQLAIAGPIVSLILYAGLAFLAVVLPEWGQIVFGRLAILNLGLAGFNLIPALPLDGGQVLAALIWTWTGDRLKGMRWASRSGQILGGVAITVGCSLLVLDLNETFSGGWLALLGWFIWRQATVYHRLTTLQSTLLQIPMQEVDCANVQLLEATTTVQQFTDHYLQVAQPDTVFLTIANQSQPLESSECATFQQVLVSAVQGVERSQWARTTLAEITLPLIASVVATATLAQGVFRLETHDADTLVIVTTQGDPIGVCDRSDIVRTIAQKLKIPVPEAEINQIKDTGDYPPGLQLPQILKPYCS